METRKQAIKKVLNKSKKINPDEVSDNNGNLDFKKMSSHPVCKEQIKELNKMKVSCEELRANGFILGAMVLSRYLKY